MTDKRDADLWVRVFRYLLSDDNGGDGADSFPPLRKARDRPRRAERRRPYRRRAAKNCRSRSAHSSASTPPQTSTP